MKIQAFWIVMPLLIALSGCSTGNHVGGPDGSYALGIVCNHQFYAANEAGISKVGKQIGQITKYENHMLTNSTKGTVSNSSMFPVGTKIYKVPGKDESQAIAVKDSNGKYLEIDAASN